MTVHEPGTQGPWLPIYTGMVALVLVMVDRFRLAPGLHWWHLPILTAVCLVGAFLVTVMQEANRGQGGWIRIGVHRIATVGVLGVWAAWAAVSGWHTWTVLTPLLTVAGLAVLGAHCQTPAAVHRRQGEPELPDAPDRRDATTRRWEGIIRQVTRLPVVVTGWDSWDNPDDGMRLTVELPADQGTTGADLAAKAVNIASAARLPAACAVRIVDSDVQGVVHVDVMLRNCLVDRSEVHVEPTTPASILDEFPVMTTPRGDVLSICLRVYSMIIGGTADSGKTTLLHRIIMWLARCTDTLIWVVDLNGGGVAEPWISPWANGRTPKPVVDWVADSEEEAAVMAAVARAVAVDRKTNREATRRKKAANTTLLPVSPDMPAFVVITDEGGEVRQAVSLFGQLAGQGITRLAQIARAEGGRVIMSVLRGTSDLTDKGLRVVAAIRLCLRMEEHDEYAHVLGANPGKIEFGGVSGVGFLRTASIPRPAFARTRNVDLAGIDRHAVACGPLRPDLDQWGLRAAARVTPADVLGGRQPAEEHMANQAMRDCLEGRAYTGRWDRYAAKLAEMRNEDVEPDESEEPVAAAPARSAPPVASRTSALDAWAASVDRTIGAAPAQAADGRDGARVIRFAPRNTATPTPEPQIPDTARERILTLLREAGPEGVASSALAADVGGARSRVYDLLKQLRDEQVIGRNGSGVNVLAEFAQTSVG